MIFLSQKTLRNKSSRLLQKLVLTFFISVSKIWVLLFISSGFFENIVKLKILTPLISRRIRRYQFDGTPRTSKLSLPRGTRWLTSSNSGSIMGTIFRHNAKLLLHGDKRVSGGHFCVWRFSSTTDRSKWFWSKI